ncbi:hypothetical protein DEI86_13490 [Curtobacterium sp. MCBD17_028]|nr:hypothetical protein DEI86_13490 [Curtobacterium sp. MCBD17_028]
MQAAPAARGYTQAMKNMTGGIVGLNTSMMLTGSATKGLQDRTTEVGKAMNSTADFQKKWNLTSQTTANRLAVAKQTLANVGTTIAGDVLPGLANTAKGFATGVNAAVRFASANSSWLKPLVLGLGGALIAFKSIGLAMRGYALLMGLARAAVVSYTLVTKGMAAAQAVATTATFGLDAAMDANPIGLVTIAIEFIIAALAALVAGVVYAYTHWAWFHDGVTAAWKGIQAAAAFAWNSVLKPTFAWIVSAVTTVGNAAVWLWKNVFVPAWDGIASGATWLWSSVIKPVFDGIGVGVRAVGGFFVSWWNTTVTVFKAIGAAAVAVGQFFVVLWTAYVAPPLTAIGKAVAYLWSNYVYPIFDLIGHIFLWVGAQLVSFWTTNVQPIFSAIGRFIAMVWTTYIQPTFVAISAFITNVLAAAINWLWTVVIVPAWTGITKAITWAWSVVLLPTFNAIVSFVRTVLGAVFSWLWTAVIQPAWNAISGAISWAWTVVIRPAFAAIHSFITGTLVPAFQFLWNSGVKPAWNSISSHISSVWNNDVKPVFNALKGFVTKTIPDAFSTAVGAVGKAWDGLKSIAKAPIKFVVDTVINDALIGNFNKVAGFFGSKKMPKVALPKGFAGGGVIPGYQAARRDDVMTPMRRGEGVLVPEVVRALGPGFVHALNAAGNRGGVQGVRSAVGYAGGGVVGAIKGAASTALDWGKDAAGAAGAFIRDPSGTLGRLVRAAIARIPGGGAMTSVASSAANNLLGSALSALKSLGGVASVIGSIGNAGGSSGTPAGSGVARWQPDVVKALAANGLSTSSDMVAKVLRQIQTESGGNPKAIQGNIGDINNRTGDLAKGLMQTISTTFAAYQFPGHGDIFNGYDNMLAALNYAKHTYGPNLNGLGEGHGYAYGGVVGTIEPTLYDTGGMLPTGPTLVMNKTGRPEHVFTDRQLTELVTTGGGVTKHLEPHFHSEGREFTLRDYMELQHRTEVMAGGRR